MLLVLGLVDDRRPLSSVLAARRRGRRRCRAGRCRRSAGGGGRRRRRRAGRAARGRCRQLGEPARRSRRAGRVIGAGVCASASACLPRLAHLGIVYGFVLAAAIAGFLVWNWPRARMFLGDNGAYSVAVFLVYGFFLASRPASQRPVLVASGLLGVFAVDLAVTLDPTQAVRPPALRGRSQPRLRPAARSRDARRADRPDLCGRTGGDRGVGGDR